MCNTHTHTHTHTRIYTYIPIFMFTYRCMDMHTRIYIHIYTRTRTVKRRWLKSTIFGGPACRGAPVQCSVYYTSIGFLQAVAGTCACEQMYAVLMCVYIHTHVNACIHTGAWHVSTLTQSYVYMFKFTCMDTCRIHYTSVGFIPHRGCQSLPRPRSQRAQWGTCIYKGASGRAY